MNITTSLPNGVVSINQYDAAGRLLELTHTASDDSLIARYEYVLDKVGNRTVVTETVLQPGMVPQAGAFLEENGLLVVEAESGQTSAGGNTAWISQTVQAGCSGAAYLRAIPDVGELLSAAEAESGPQVSFPIDIQTTGTYAVWVRARAADGAGDSVHIGLDGQVAETADNLTGFAPNTWGWSRLTLDSGNATLSLGSSGAYTLGLFMREDGIRVDKLLLITDTNYIPTGLGPDESQQQVVTGTTSTPVVQIVIMAYDPLHRLSEADYSGAYTATYGYAYDAVDNRTAYTTTITSTTIITYQYDAANRLVESVEVGGDTTTYEWDNAGRLITTTAGVHVGRVYTYSQDGDMLAALANGLLTTFDYDGDGNRLRMAVAGEVTTYTLDYADSFRLLFEEGGAFSDTKHYLYGLECIAELVDAGEPESEWRFYQRDGSSMVRQTTNMQATVTLAWTYSPEGMVLLGEEGPVTNLDCSGNTIYDFSTGLIFKNGKYFDPNTGIWVTMSGLVIYQVGWIPYNRKRKWSKGKKCIVLLFVLLFLALTLAGCGGIGGGDPAQAPTNTPCPLPPPQIGEQPPLSIIVLGGSDPNKGSTEPGPPPSIQIPHFAERATAVVPYPGGDTAKLQQAANVPGYAGDLLIIGYSAGADTALIYADMYMKAYPEQEGDWNIKGIALLGPTMTGAMNDGILDDKWDDILDRLLMGGTDVFWLDDGTLTNKEFNQYPDSPPPCTGRLKKVRRDMPHHENGRSGNATNNNYNFSIEVFNWFGVGS